MGPGKSLAAIVLTVAVATSGVVGATAGAEPNYLCTDAAYRAEMLELHNNFRATHHAPGLQLDEKLNRLAEDWAQRLAATHTFEHRPDNEFGENLYMMRGNGGAFAGAESAFRAWADEEEAVYDYNKPGFSMETGHFTQVVWKATERLGVARACNPESGETYVVANYDPAGNYEGRFPENVLRPS
ncbi:secretion protein [Nocardia flavorosea]|uniref:CAP family protein n=2 Tax=Nocardia TaxID=1817 RepID=UPI001893B82B|nr:CAP family protein [Nocardia flavorosea]MBF6352904.1 secretion protein [Nocardia flavorosea]